MVGDAIRRPFFFGRHDACRPGRSRGGYGNPDCPCGTLTPLEPSGIAGGLQVVIERENNGEMHKNAAQVAQMTKYEPCPKNGLQMDEAQHLTI